MSVVDYIYSNGMIAEKIRCLFIGLKLYYPYNIYNMYRIRKKMPVPDSLIHARQFFAQNQDRINDICMMLSDEKSKITYKKIILLRQYYRKEDIPEYDYRNQYFPKDIPQVNSSRKEVFVDCGAFNGDICMAFVKHNKRYKKIYAFEPDRRNIEKFKKRKLLNCQLIEAACSDKDGSIKFCESNQSGGSHITDESNDYIEVPCVKIDTCVDDEVTFIKMDIEGAEMNALRGAQEIIKKYRPKLAISIYHSNEDMIDIPQYIHSLVPEYRMYIRAHTMGIAETILYCIV